MLEQTAPNTQIAIGVPVPVDNEPIVASETLERCPLCLDDKPRSQLRTTPCAHRFCGSCIDKWTATATAGCSTCPVCRTALPGQRSQPPQSEEPRPAQNRLRDRLERAHEERTAAHQRRVRNEERYARYTSQMMTPSGRPYEDLPVVSLSELRDQLKDNARGLGMADVQVTAFLR